MTHGEARLAVLARHVAQRVGQAHRDVRAVRVGAQQRYYRGQGGGGQCAAALAF